MHKVKRNSAPTGLIEKDKRWREQLSQNPDSEHKWENFNRDLKREVIEKLSDMYAGCCCYCEDRVSNSYAHIEHFKPKSEKRFKELCYDYSNMHYCCQKCNMTKADTYDDNMISPTGDDPEKHIIFEKYSAKPLDSRGDLMICVLELNKRKELEKARADTFKRFEKLYNVVVNCVDKIQRASLTKEELECICFFIEEVEEASKHEYGKGFCSMIKHNFYKNALIIKELLGIQTGG